MSKFHARKAMSCTRATTYLRHTLLITGLLLSSSQAPAGEPGKNTRDVLWASPDQGIVLFHGSRSDTRRVCPVTPGLGQQPFCRTFSATVLAACGSAGDLQLVLANGEVHHVNGALIGIDGGFKPARQPTRALNLVKAWVPRENCNPADGFSDILAVAADGELWHFDDLGWQHVSGHRMGLQ